EPAPSEPDVEFGKPEIPAEPLAKPKEARIIKIVVCPNCGTENETKDRFCYNCGKKLKPEKKKVMKPKKIILPAKLLAKPTIKKPVQPAVKTLPKAIELPARKKIVKKVKKKPIEGNL
ncbi:MAG: zinc ribbon domain-containing protein, partial [Candidatus Aenigmarchaeota archaeon]|nr:zinc ribbon domain-containing protein [Candidatus Aenigmarchaeota archaeon]